jgi:TrmH family RNA methyltransferase
MAVDAFDVLKKARVCDSLSQALEDINLAVATSSGQYRRHTSQNMIDFFAQIFSQSQGPDNGLSEKNTIAIVFGDERNGMTNDEIDRCHSLMRIETNPAFPSLNLAQALGIVAYQLSLGIASTDNKKSPAAEDQVLRMSGEEEDQLMEKVVMLMDQSEFSRSFSRKKVQRELRSTLQRLDLSQREGDLWRGFITNILGRLPPPH